MEPLYEELTAIHLDSGWEYDEQGIPIDEFPESIRLDFFLQSWSIAPEVAGARFAEMLVERHFEDDPSATDAEREIIQGFIDRMIRYVEEGK